MWRKFFPCLFLLLWMSPQIDAQEIVSLKNAVETAVGNYGTIKAKEAYSQSAEASLKQIRREYLPNVVLAAQQDYGTINGQNGPLYGFGGFAASSSGLPLAEQNWNAAFGALYLVNVNWEVFAFGKAKRKINVAKNMAERDRHDLDQEIFQHKIKVAGAYLNLLSARQLSYSYQKNVERTNEVRRAVTAKALSGLVAGVDSSLAKSDHANALIAYTRARDNEQQQANQLAVLMGVERYDFELDTTLYARIPFDREKTTIFEDHPRLRYEMDRMAVNEEQQKLLKSQYFPSVSLVGIYQARASGFGNGYAQDQTDFNTDYWDGINPTRQNYLLGLGVTWNLTQPYRLSQGVKSQKLTGKGLQEEYKLAQQELKAQWELSENKWQNAIAVYDQVPIQLQAANDAYIQRSVRYRNGLTDLTDLSQAIYALIRAETDRDIAIGNVWQALLLKAAASGDFDLFENEL